MALRRFKWIEKMLDRRGQQVYDSGRPVVSIVEPLPPVSQRSTSPVSTQSPKTDAHKHSQMVYPPE